MTDPMGQFGLIVAGTVIVLVALQMSTEPTLATSIDGSNCSRCIVSFEQPL